MLTESQKKKFIEVCKVYPQGVKSNAWGYGPMDDTEKHWDQFDEDEKAEYG